MAQAEPLSPPIDATFEVETIGFDYGFVLAPGETIVSVSEMLINVLSGTDASVTTRLIGSPQVANSVSTNAPRAMVLQKVGNVLAGCNYGLQCVVLTTDGQSLSIQTQLPSEPSLTP